MAEQDKYKEVLERARKRFSYVADYDKENRARQKSSTEFVYVPGKSWPDKARADRKANGDPCMEFGEEIAVEIGDGAKVTTAYSLAVTGANIGTVVTVTDQALKQRRSITKCTHQRASFVAIAASSARRS